MNRPDIKCQQERRALNLPYPRTCQMCNLGPCQKMPKVEAPAIPLPSVITDPTTIQTDAPRHE